MKLLNLIVAIVLILSVGFLGYKYFAISKTDNPVITTNDDNFVFNADFPNLKILKSYDPPVKKTNDEWHKILTPEQYGVLREAGTETPFTGELLHNKEKGIYITADCDEEVFSSDAKFDSGTGWPSFYQAINPDAVVFVEDDSFGMKRVEVVGKKCGGHLGHIFNDGPAPTGLRFCMNSLALKFKPEQDNP